MEVLLYILALAGGGATFWWYLDSKKLEASQRKVAEKLGFESVLEEGSPSGDRFVRAPIFEGEIDGVIYRIFTLQVCKNDQFSGRMQPTTDESSKQWVTGLAVPIDQHDLYIMAHQRISPGEASIIEEERDFVESDSALQSDYLVLTPDGTTPPFLKAPRVETILVELARAYSAVRICNGWLTIANDTFEPDLVDVDLQHLAEARSRILEAVGDGH